VILEIAGVWDDGTPRADDAPLGTAFTLRFARNATVTVRCQVVDLAGIDVDLTGFTGTLSIKRGILLEDVVKKIVGTIDTTVTGRIDFVIPALDVDPGRCAYDVWLTSGGGEKQQVVALSPLLLGYAAGP
jgi:hypothetical protein